MTAQLQPAQIAILKKLEREGCPVDIASLAAQADLLTGEARDELVAFEASGLVRRATLRGAEHWIITGAGKSAYRSATGDAPAPAPAAVAALSRAAAAAHAIDAQEQEQEQADIPLASTPAAPGSTASAALDTPELRQRIVDLIASRQMRSAAVAAALGMREAQLVPLLSAMSHAGVIARSTFGDGCWRVCHRIESQAEPEGAAASQLAASPRGESREEFEADRKGQTGADLAAKAPLPTAPPSVAAIAAPISEGDSAMQKISTRMKVMAAVASGLTKTVDIAKKAGIEAAAASYHLTKLRESGDVMRTGSTIDSEWHPGGKTPSQEFVAKKRAEKKAAPPARKPPGRAPTFTVTEALDLLSSKLQPVEDLSLKVATLDRLATFVDKSIADVLVRVRDDLVARGA